MRKMYIKTGLLVVMACLSLLTAGFISSGNAMAYHRPYSPHAHSHHAHPHIYRPHIVLKMLPSSGQYFNHQYVARAIIYGVGFDNCSNCGSDQDNSNPCDSGCTSPTPSDTPPPCDSGCTPPTPSDTTSPCDAGCSTTHQEVTDHITTTDVQTTTTTTTTTNVTKNVTHHDLGCTSGCSTPLPPNTVPCSPCNNDNYNNARNNNNYNATPAPNATCPSYNDCGSGPSNSGSGPNDTSTAPNDTSAAPNDSGNGCDCGNTANLQGNVPFTAPGVNLSQVPVDTFGEFRVGVNIRMTPRQARTRPSFWATNSYNGQRSDTTSAPCCSSAFCCQ